jgi:hypothetical protein
VQGSEKSGRHHRGGDQVFLTFLSSAILKFVRIRQTSQRRRSGIFLTFLSPGILKFVRIRQTSQRRRSGIPDILSSGILKFVRIRLPDIQEIILGVSYSYYFSLEKHCYGDLSIQPHGCYLAISLSGCTQKFEPMRDCL